MQLFRNLFSELNYGNVKLHFLSNTQLLVFFLFTNSSENGYVFMEAVSRTKCVSTKIMHTLICALLLGSRARESIVEVRREHRSIVSTVVTCQHYCCQHTHIHPDLTLSVDIERVFLWPWSAHTQKRRKCWNPNLGIYTNHNTYSYFGLFTATDLAHFVD